MLGKLVLAAAVLIVLVKVLLQVPQVQSWIACYNATGMGSTCAYQIIVGH